MPRGNERISSNVERVVKRGACTLSKRSTHWNIYRIPSKERSSSVPDMRNLEQSVLFTLDHGSWKLLVPLYVFLQGPEGRNQSGSETDSNLDFLEILEQTSSSPERPGSAESFTASSSSDSSVLAKSRNRNRRTKSVKGFSGTSQASTVLNSISDTHLDALNIFALDESINNISEVEKPVNRSSRKKRKKKGKQYKTSGQRKAVVLSQSEEDISNVVLSQSEEDISNVPVTCTFYNNEICNSEPMASLPWEFSGQSPSYDQSGRFESSNQAMSSRSPTSTEIILCTSPGQTSQNGTCVTSSSISDDQDSCLEANSFLDKLKIDTFGNSSDGENCDNATKQSPANYKYACNSSELRLSFNWLENNVPFQCIPAESWDKSSETSSYCSMGSPDWSKYVVDADCAYERVQHSSVASCSNDFHLVVNRKRGRLARKPSFNSKNSLHNPGGMDNNHSIWQMVQKNGTAGCICGSGNDIVCQHIDISSTGSDVWERSDRVEGRKQNASGILCSCPCSDERVVETADKDPIPSASSDVNSTDLSKAINRRLLHNSLENLKRRPYIKLHSNGADSVDNQSIKLETQSLHSDNSRPDSTSGPALQKSSHVGRRASVLFDKECSEVPTVNDPTPDRLHSGKIKLELPISNSHHSILSNNGGLPCLSSHSEGGETTCSPPPEVDELARKFEPHPFPVQNFRGVEWEARSFAGFETDLCRIMQAVNESYKLLTVSEAFRVMTGSPLAEFERFLHAATPIISQSISNCKTCSQDQIIGDALCIHQVPRISLRDLWQWYERPGCYGLEVKVDDRYNSKRSHNGCSQFRAYFVPYLSAVQLFARSSSSVCFNNGVSNKGTKECCKEDTASKSSRSLESLPILSVLLPQPCKVAPSGKGEAFCQTIKSSNSTDEELLFEYFEAEHPPVRKPLHEKIKELVRGEKSCKSRVFGNPSKLEYLNLHDLHPASWYSVAWYPIYRVPNGNFRAAFLTYHSLGRFVHRSTSSNLIGDITQIVSPVVGMQSYNAKGECWLPQRGFSSNKVRMEKGLSPNPSETLNERLRTLENAASVMARATVCEGNKKYVNVHPDYEFFLSRRQ